MTNASISSDPTPPNAAGIFLNADFMNDLRQQMLKFARLQVRDDQLAEDAVQEAMLSAYKNIDRFSRQAALKTWVFSILKNKLIDLLRKEKRYTAASQLEEGPNVNGEELIEVLFNKHGHWQKSERPQKWDTPDHGVENAHFWRVFDACLNALPEKYSRYFMMREFLEMDTTEICHNEDLTVTNLNVTLYRARLRLRKCLEDNWYQTEKTS
ncbi:RNA polymerase factor sigma-70 [Marinomonas pollencensis]|uniref:RNA polymerase sigma-70 factor (ECF subfamily) n=1 Tax=Marinomonas pollencensis TaxID=491954 RepID=A0A3E0DNI3_9GAMM|nr:RNA polymerase factor sigma-70 [Marinomonas pollencensis]REG83736.1 RNA polymerase sigma-70 factor (ECF subfamily) [Marinomonas pollencensis]